MSASPVSQSTSGAINYTGTITTSAAAAAVYKDETNATTNVSSIDIPSGQTNVGTSGNLLYAAANFQDADRDPVTVSSPWTKFLEETSATASSEFILVCAQTNAPDWITFTDDTGAGSDECCGHIFELVAAAGSSGNPWYYYANQ